MKKECNYHGDDVAAGHRDKQIAFPNSALIEHLWEH